MANGTQLTCFLTLAACVASVLVSLWLTSSRPPPPGEVRIFTAADLAADARLLLVVVGDVVDVSSGVSHVECGLELAIPVERCWGRHGAARAGVPPFP